MREVDYGDRKPLLKFISKEIKMTKYIDRYYLNWEMYAIKFGGGGWLPAEYQKVEYIESTWTQLIDTWYLITPNTEVSVDYQFTSANAQDFVFGVGSDTNTSSWMTFCVYIGYWWSSLWSVFRGWISDWTYDNTWANNWPTKDTNRHTFVLNNWHFLTYNSSWTLQSDVTTQRTITRTAEHSFWLFCWWRTDLWPSRQNKTAAKLYWCTIKESWTLQRNFVPCYRIADSVVWLYDTVNNVFYTNDGTWSFIKWPDA